MRSIAGITDGTSNTVGFATRFGKFLNGASRAAATYDNATGAAFPINSGGTAQPPQIKCNPATAECEERRAHSFYAGGTPVALMDGSCRMVGPGVTAATWTSVLSADGGEVLANDW